MKKHLYALFALLSSGVGLSAQTLSNYQATVNAQSPNFYFTFDGGSLTDTRGHGSTLAPTSPSPFTQLVPDVFVNQTNATFFIAKGDTIIGSGLGIINGGGAAANSDLTQTTTGAITLLFRSPDPGTNNSGYLCIFSGGNNTTNRNALGLFIENNKATTSTGSNNFPDSLKLRFGSSSQVILPQTSIVPNTWYYFALSYTESTNSGGAFVDATGTNVIGKAKWFVGPVGGTLTSGLTTNSLDSMSGDGSDLYIGNELDTTHGFVSGAVDEFATWTRQLSDLEVSNQFARLPSAATPSRSTYESAVSAQSPFYYFKMDGNYLDSVNNTLTLAHNNATNASLPVAFTYDYFGGSTNAAQIVLAGDCLTNNGNLLSGGGTYTGTPGSGTGSISFLFRTLNSYVNQGNRYLYSAGGSPGTSNRFELFFNTFSSVSDPYALKMGFGDSSTTILPVTNFAPAVWYYFAMTYDESKTNKQVTWWLGQPGGTLNSGTLSATNGSLAGQGNVFVIGSSTNLVANSFRNSTPAGNGRLQDFAIWHRALNGTEVTNQFNALVGTGATAPAPSLKITYDGVRVILSWPSTTDAGYALQSISDLNLTNWVSAGSPTVVGTNNVVTNTASGTARYYRLKK